MRYLVVVAALMLAGPAMGQNASRAADLATVCSTTAADPVHNKATGFCEGVLVGAFRYYLSSVAPADRFVCAPNPVPRRGDVMAGFVAWLKANSRYNEDDAVDVLFRYLAETYPCKK